VFDARPDIVLRMTQPNLSARDYHRTQGVNLVRTIVDVVEALHALRSSEIDDCI
jgi:hypothetical protein